MQCFATGTCRVQTSNQTAESQDSFVAQFVRSPPASTIEDRIVNMVDSLNRRAVGKRPDCPHRDLIAIDIQEAGGVVLSDIDVHMDWGVAFVDWFTWFVGWNNLEVSPDGNLVDGERAYG